MHLASGVGISQHQVVTSDRKQLAVALGPTTDSHHRSHDKDRHRKQGSDDDHGSSRHKGHHGSSHKNHIHNDGQNKKSDLAKPALPRRSAGQNFTEHPVSIVDMHSPKRISTPTVPVVISTTSGSFVVENPMQPDTSRDPIPPAAKTTSGGGILELSLWSSAPMCQLVEAFEKFGFELVFRGEKKKPTNEIASGHSSSSISRVSWLSDDYVCVAAEDDSIQNPRLILQITRLIPVVTLSSDHVSLREWSAPLSIRTAEGSAEDWEVRACQASVDAVTQSKVPYSVAVISGRKSSALTSILTGRLADNEIIVLDQDLDTKTSQLLFGHKFRVRGIEWSRCGRLLASVAAPLDLSATESCEQKAQSMMQGIVDFFSKSSRDSSEEYSSTSGYIIGEVIVWDLEYVQPTFRKVIFSGHVEPFIKAGSNVEEQRLISICWSPCGSYLACGCTNYVFLLDAATGKIVNADKMSITADDGSRQIDYPRALRWGQWGESVPKDGTCVRCAEYLAVGSRRKKNNTRKESALSIWKLSKDEHRKSRFKSEKCSLFGVPLDRVLCLDWSWSKNAADELTLVCLSYNDSDRSSALVQQWHRSGNSADRWEVRRDVTIGNAPGLWLAFKDDSTFETSLAVSTPEQVYRFVKRR